MNVKKDLEFSLQVLICLLTYIFFVDIWSYLYCIMGISTM